MATFLNKSFQTKLFVSVGGIFLLFVFLFTAYQYQREKDHKTDLMRARMQVYNLELAHALGDSLCSRDAFMDYIRHNSLKGLRVTVMDLHGRVVQDSRYEDFEHLPSHMDRTEVRQAMLTGSGYDIKRTSVSTKDTYFYAATLAGEHIIRSAVPYSASLAASLRPSYSFLWYTMAVTLLLGVVLFRSTQRITRHIGYLREFAEKADRGEKLDHELERKLPDDELGDISHNIIMLFWKLRHSEDDKQRLKHQLTQNAAHELKTPAASINGYLESIVSNPEMPEETRRHFLQRCYDQSRRMCRLLQDMTILTRMDEIPQGEGVKDLMAMPAVNIREMVEGILDESEPELLERGMKPMVEIPDEVAVRGDKNMLYGVFRNLVDNALAYATGATMLRFSCHELLPKDGAPQSMEPRWWKFCVADNGCGVEPEHLAHIFERFYRVDKGRSRKMGGTGLGLAIVKNTIAAYGGVVDCTITPGGGLTISFTLPVCEGKG